MKQKTELGLSLLGAALLLGLLGDALLREMPWGLNALAWTAALVDAAAALVIWRRVKAAGEGRWLLLPLLFCAAAIAWRDSPTLQGLNALGWVVALGLAAVHARSGQIRVAGVMQYGLGV